jgi:hypothetical protein
MITLYGQAEVAQWVDVTPQTIAMWIMRYDDYPVPDARIVTEKQAIRGWRAERRAEWEKYARMRAASPGAALVAMRKDRR